MNSAGGHLSTLGDMARWITVHMDGGKIDGRQVFPPAAVELSHRLIASHTVEQSKTFAYFHRDGWGAGWDIGSYDGEPMISRFGSYHSIRSHVSFLPRRRIGVIAMANGRPGWTLTDLVAAFAYDLEAGRADARERAESRLTELLAQRDRFLKQVAAGDSTRAARQQQSLDRPLEQFVGTYTNDAFGSMTFAMREGRLRFTWGVLSGPVEIFDASRHQMRFEMAGGGQVAGFVFDGAGPATAVLLGSSQFRRQ
jgi:hypothetical protein